MVISPNCDSIIFQGSTELYSLKKSRQFPKYLFILIFNPIPTATTANDTNYDAFSMLIPNLHYDGVNENLIKTQWQGDPTDRR